MLPFSEIFLLHRLTDDRADGVRRVLLHLGCGVGVGVEREPCGVVAQGSREGLHVHAVLELHRLLPTRQFTANFIGELSVG